ncbi:hypothetical protein BRADI_4g31063v3 [Brachypodium distachyon]|uniref:Secreted peptide n=1 Tax=Brachypodium distachyon TaxID=15368 RepID=A0A2K2CRJ8_BRADI|nr:hypothetical protein BRADI_4g31063v3 [Brachypodium distachyon]
MSILLCILLPFLCFGYSCCSRSPLAPLVVVARSGGILSGCPSSVRRILVFSHTMLSLRPLLVLFLVQISVGLVLFLYACKLSVQLV